MENTDAAVAEGKDNLLARLTDYVRNDLLDDLAKIPVFGDGIEFGRYFKQRAREKAECEYESKPTNPLDLLDQNPDMDHHEISFVGERRLGAEEVKAYEEEQQQAKNYVHQKPSEVHQMTGGDTKIVHPVLDLDAIRLYDNAF